ncbi:MAG: hypothetical protein ACJAQT_000078 [Akkermansiaceae bacterium]|jgi:hypothetical protein
MTCGRFFIRNVINLLSDMSQSPELAAGEGFTFEGTVAAFYLSAMLAEAYAPGVNDHRVVKVSVQQRDFGEPLDDIIIDFAGNEDQRVRLSLQAKQSLTVSRAKTNADFREVIQDSWRTLQKQDFRRGADRYGAVTENIATGKKRSLKTLCDYARASLSAQHFEERFSDTGNASLEIKNVKDDIEAILIQVRGEPCSSEELHLFLSHFVVITLDLLREGAADISEALNSIESCLKDEIAGQAPAVWEKLRGLAREHAGRSGQFNRSSLVHTIGPLARLKSSVALQSDVEILRNLATSYVDRIHDDIGGFKLERVSLQKELSKKLTTSRFVQVRGLPGSGKSVIMRRLVSSALSDGPVLFLKAEQIEQSSWINFAIQHGLSGAKLEELLVEIGAIGTPILFLDAIDRIEKRYQPLVLDLLHTISKSSILENWRVVVSLRDTGVEALNIWLSDYLSGTGIGTVEVGSLDDDEAGDLAEKRPHLQALLFGSREVREIARRPFFAKILDQGFVTDPSSPITAPRSELDLMKNWWSRGGYNVEGSEALKRQRSLIELASTRSRNLSNPIKIGRLNSLDEIGALRSDGILQDAYPGISVRFSHDIFFEWAFLHLLLDSDDGWIAEIKGCGEPPAVGRSVELLSQLKFEQADDWAGDIKQCQDEEFRSQWLRAWLFGPVSSPIFEEREKVFGEALAQDGFCLFRKLLVWFQAEKTTPNPNVLSSSLPFEDRQMYAYSWSWPSDFRTWNRMIRFIIRRIPSVPVVIFPTILSVFEIWQNALSETPNSISRAILKRCAEWLLEIEMSGAGRSYPKTDSPWGELADGKTFKQDIITLLIGASKIEPDHTKAYLARVMASDSNRDESLPHILRQAHLLAQSMPETLVEVTLTSLKRRLPEEVKKDVKKRQSQSMIPHDFGSYDWDNLSIEDDCRTFYPESPLREPFQSLFQFAPQEALRLVRELCNHAMTAWQQLHRLSYKSRGIPVPLELEFPWGSQSFWGNSREYRFYRGVFGPNAVCCGLMAMEKWAFEQLDQGEDADGILRQILEGNSCIAVLGIASMIAMEKELASWTTLPLFTSQRLLEMDLHRRVEDSSSMQANLIGFANNATRHHFDMVRKMNERPVRQKDLRSQIPMFVFGEKTMSERVRALISTFEDRLPFEYEEDQNVAEIRDRLTEDARRYAELVDCETYKAYRVSEDSEQIALVHESPSAARPENVAIVEEASQRLTEGALWAWASKCLEEKSISGSYTLPQAIELAKAAVSRGILDPSTDDSKENRLGVGRGAVTAVAAVALHFRGSLEETKLEWAREIIAIAIGLPEEQTQFWTPSAIISWHPCIFVARAIASEIYHGTEGDSSYYDLLSLVAHPLECVAKAALGESIELWDVDPHFSWATLTLALDLLHILPTEGDQMRTFDVPLHTQDRLIKATDRAFENYASEEWQPLLSPPPAWIENGVRRHRSHRSSFGSDEDEHKWGEPEVVWNTNGAEEILKILPLEKILSSTAGSQFLIFLVEVLDWTAQKNSKPWKKGYERNRVSSELIAWNRTLGGRLGFMAGLVSFAEFRDDFLIKICSLPGEVCWSLLEPMTSGYICEHVYDSKDVAPDTSEFLNACLERFLEAPEFENPSYRGREFTGFNDSRLVRLLMFVDIEKAELASRFVNGDWSEIELILPLVDRFIRKGAHLICVAEAYVTLCERSKEFYPADAFSVLALEILRAVTDDGRQLGKNLIPARIAELVQYFSHREPSLELKLARQFLQILDELVDLGDRRAAALQLDEAFREVQLD